MATAHGFSTDTSDEVSAMLVQRWRSMSVVEKFQAVAAANRDCALLAEAGVRHRYPEANEEEVRLRVAALHLGRDLSVAVYGWDPHVEGW